MRIIALAVGTLTTAAALSLTGVAEAGAVPNISVGECFAGGGIPLRGDCVGGIHNGQPITW